MITAKMPVSADIVRRGLPWPVGIGVRHLADIDETSTARGTGGRDARLLYPGEEEVLGPRAVAERRQLFALGRAAARDALGELGFAPVAIGRGEGGEPLWPAGVVGSISHSRQVAVAVAGLRQDYVGLGVDVEGLSRALQPRAARLICRPSE